MKIFELKELFDKEFLIATKEWKENNKIQQSSGASSDYRMKWISTPYTLRKNAICQSTNLIEENFKEAENQNIEDDEDDFCKIEVYLWNNLCDLIFFKDINF